MTVGWMHRSASPPSPPRRKPGTPFPAPSPHGQAKAPGGGVAALPCAALVSPEQLSSHGRALGRMAPSAAEHSGARSEFGREQRTPGGNQPPLGSCTQSAT